MNNHEKRDLLGFLDQILGKVNHKISLNIDEQNQFKKLSKAYLGQDAQVDRLIFLIEDYLQPRVYQEKNNEFPFSEEEEMEPSLASFVKTEQTVIITVDAEARMSGALEDSN